MKINYKNLPKEEISPGIFRIWIFDERAGTKNFFMRLFEIAPLKETQADKHPYEHEIFILKGKGTVEIDYDKFEVASGDAVYIAPNKLHQIRNTGDTLLQFICMVPGSYREYKKNLASKNVRGK